MPNRTIRAPDEEGRSGVGGTYIRGTATVSKFIEQTSSYAAE